MAASVKGDVRGLAELTKRLKEMASLAEVEKISHRGTFGLSKDIKLQAMSNIVARNLLETGTMWENVAMKRIVYGTMRGYTVGIRAGAPSQIKSGNDPYYWWWVHFGTKNLAPSPFLTDAYHAFEGKGFDAISRAAIKAIEASAARALAKHKNPPKKG